MIKSIRRTQVGGIPQIRTKRLTLRRMLLDDLDNASRMWGDAKVTKYIGGRPRTRQDVWSSVQRSYGSWALLGYGYWAIIDTWSQKFVGEIGFMEALRDIEPSIEGVPEAGWCLSYEVWGKGVASEALAAVIDWADTELQSETVCIINPSNTASVRVAQKFGYSLQSQSELKGVKTDIYKRSIGRPSTDRA